MNSLPLKNINGDSIGEYEIADNLLINNKGEQAVHEARIPFRSCVVCLVQCVLALWYNDAINAMPYMLAPVQQCEAGL